MRHPVIALEAAGGVGPLMGSEDVAPVADGVAGGDAVVGLGANEDDVAWHPAATTMDANAIVARRLTNRFSLIMAETDGRPTIGCATVTRQCVPCFAGP